MTERPLRRPEGEVARATGVGKIYRVGSQADL